MEAARVKLSESESIVKPWKCECECMRLVIVN